MTQNEQFTIQLRKRENLLNKKLMEIVPLAPELVTDEVRTNYGSLQVLNIFCDAEPILQYLKERLKKERFEKAKDKVEKHMAMLDTGEVDLGLLGDFQPDKKILSAITGDQRDILAVLSDHPEVLKECSYRMFLYTKPLPLTKDQLRNLFTKLYEWGGPDVTESVWYQGWRNENGNLVKGLAVKLRELVFNGRWTLSSFEKRIDKEWIEPIRIYLSQKGVGPGAEPSGIPFSEKCLLCDKVEEDEFTWVGLCSRCARAIGVME